MAMFKKHDRVCIFWPSSDNGVHGVRGTIVAISIVSSARVIYRVEFDRRFHGITCMWFNGVHLLPDIMECPFNV